jgi:hypothetical protein
LNGTLHAVVWRASLESPQTRERRGFVSLDDLFDFLRQQTGVRPGSDEGGLLNAECSAKEME